MSGTENKKKGFNRRVLLGAACALMMAGAVPVLAQAAQQSSGVHNMAPARGLTTAVALEAAASAPAAPAAATLPAVDVRFMDKAAVQKFYTARGNDPYWTKTFGEPKQAKALIALLEESWTHGLNPQKYHLAEISKLMASGGDKQRLEMLLTDAAMRYAHDMSGMRVDAGSLGLKSKYWRQPLTGGAIADDMAGTKDVVGMLQGLAPRGELYRKLQAELKAQAAEASKNDHLLPVTFGGAGMFKPGQSHKDVASLRALLGVKYDPMHGPENFYDDALASAIMTFQRDRNLEPDGIIGPATLVVINKSHKETQEQIVANLERLRWLDEARPKRYIMVNIPSQRLWAIEDGKVEAEMNVVVGMPTRQTKQFKTEVTGVRFNPTWTVPLGLKMQDFKPKLINNPGYLHEKGIQLSVNGRSMDPHAVDWASVSSREMNQMRFVQRPGDHNALGKIRILMPSDYDIYLHDTNHPEFFEKTQRTLSSGCVRLGDPRAVARFILKHNADWSDEKMEQLISRGKLTEVNSEAPFPVYIVYQSVWLDDAGELVFGPDVYKQDQKLVAALKRDGDFALPQPAEKDVVDAGGAKPEMASAQ